MYSIEEVTTAQAEYLISYPLSDQALFLFLRIFDQISPYSLFIQKLTTFLLQRHPPNVLVALFIFDLCPGEWNEYASYDLINCTVFTSSST